MDNTGGAIINERMRVLLLGKHTGSTRFEHSVLPGRWGGAAASSGQSRSGGGSPGLQGVADSTGVAGGGDESSWSRAGDGGGAAYEGERAEYYADGDGGGVGGDEPGDAAGGFYNAEGDVASGGRGCAAGGVFGEGDCGGDAVRGEAFWRRGELMRSDWRMIYCVIHCMIYALE